MKGSIFSNLVSYIPTDKRESREDYLTQMFAWLLDNVDGYAYRYLIFLHEKGNEQGESIGDCSVKSTDEIIVDTQRQVLSGRIDMVIESGNVHYICEHKVFSELSEDQIKKYMDDYKEIGGRNISVLVTYSRLQHKQKANVSLIWSDIYDFTNKVLREYEQNGKAQEEVFMLRQFAAYLSENGMRAAYPISMNGLMAYFDVFNVQDSLIEMFTTLTSFYWEEECPGIKTFNLTYSPQYHKRWGRIGIDFYEDWDQVAMFAGVLYDPMLDHKLEPLDKKKGPDFVIFLETNYNKSDKDVMRHYREICSSERITEVKKRLERGCGDYKYMDGLKTSPWRIVVLRRPLFDILNNKYGKDDQLAAMKAAIVEGINFLLGNRGDEL